MDSSARLMLRLCVAVICVVLGAVWSMPAGAFGRTGKERMQPWYCNGGISVDGGSSGPSASAACAAYVAKIPKTACADSHGVPGTNVFTLGSSYSASSWAVDKTGCGDRTAGYTWASAQQGPEVMSCPEGSSEAADVGCECNEGLKPGNDGKCVPYNCSAKGSYTAVTQPDVKLPGAGSGYCDQGCQVTPSSWKVDQEGQVWGVWPFKSEAKACGGKKDAGGVQTGNDSPEPAPVACGAGQCPGSVNGTNVCVACRSQTTKGPSTSASGVQPNDPKDVLDDDKNISRTDVKTDCTGAVCTTTYTYSNAKGDVIGEKSEESPAEDYCQKNPQANQCKKDSFGGACEGGFTCEGDAIQCALAKEVHTRNCQWFRDPPKPLLDAGDAAVAGGDQPDWHPAKAVEGKAFSLQTLLDTRDGLPKSCPGDRTFTVNGAAYVVAFSRLCPLLDTIGMVVQAMCLLAAAGIVFRS